MRPYYDADDEADLDAQYERMQAWYTSDEGIRWQIQDWHRRYPKCGMGGCGDHGPCTHSRTCRCVGGPDDCAATA